MANQPEPLTRAALIALPDDRRRHELIDGQHIITSSVSLAHMLTVTRLRCELHKHVEAHALGSVWGAPVDLALGEDELLKPDLFVTPQPMGSFNEWEDIHSLSLVIEVTSEATSHADRHHKRLRYLRAGVPHYWVVDPDLHQVEVWHPDLSPGTIAREQLVWPVPAEAPLVIDLEELFKG